LSLEGRELKAKSRILRRHGRMAAEKESCKPKQEPGEGWHRPRFLGYMLMKVKPLSANRILANHRCLRVVGCMLNSVQWGTSGRIGCAVDPAFVLGADHRQVGLAQQ